MKAFYCNSRVADGRAGCESSISAYRHVTATDEFKERERVRSRSRHNEAFAIGHAVEVERENWMEVMAEKDALIAGLLARLNEEHHR